MHRAVIIELRARPDQVAPFADLIDRHAHNCRTQEEGCLAFDVCQDPQDPARFILYEVYASPEAHAQHREMESFKWFMSEAPKMLLSAPDGSLFHARQTLERRAYI